MAGSDVGAGQMAAMVANAINIKIPDVPEVPKVEAVVPTVNVTSGSSSKTNTQIIEEATRKKVVIFSDHVAPEMMEAKDAPEKIIEVGDIKDGRVAAYLHAPFMSPKDVVKTLEGAGFTVLATFKVDKKGTATSITFTNAELQKASAKNMRGFASALRITVDKKNKLLNISNPIYMQRAFMQDEYDDKLATEVLESIKDSFEDAKDSSELIKFSLLGKYQFMTGMPYYEDMLEIASNSNEFVKTIGYDNAELLPYPILIENNKAKILAPKYYIALMYPTLSMSQFMSISSIPGEIEKDCDKVFR